ncbi:hypothetical protein CYY_004118 [Polysphondylium violaceum]|uniref:NB-ARC domain-containing protein n=1 Tax=Polysphondylium violaceum TaxID=133409 RepID=A0A8J4PVQ3_9MYCE|nr:hypothetical protein CYY_004118 [Polysphondylium violaceum]
MNQHCVCILHSCYQEVFSTISIFEKNSGIKFSDVKQSDAKSSDFIYKEGVLIKNSDDTISQSIRVVLSFPSNQTSGETSINTSRVLDTFKPSLVILVGTCSGYKYNKTSISKGDIIVAESAFDYQTGNNTNNGPEFSLNLVESKKSFIDTLKLLDHNKSDWKSYPSIELSTTYKREWLLRAFFEYQDHKDNLENSVWLNNEGFDIKKSIPRNTIVQKMFGKQYNKEKDELVKECVLEEDENGFPIISDRGIEKVDSLINRYGDYPFNLFTQINPNIHFGQFGCGSAKEQKYEVVSKQRISVAFKQCREKAIDTIAIDRDTHPFYLVAKNYKDISFISVKSVLDYADGDTSQNNNYIDYCNQLSSSFALHLTRSHSFKMKKVQLIYNTIPSLPMNSIDRINSDNKNYIQSILDSFISKPNSVTISSLISGMGGVGKSTLAKQFALYCIKNELYQYIFWIRGETNETLLESYKEVLQHLKVEIINQDNITIFSSTIQQLKGTCLLIYDNIEDTTLIEKVPQGANINILITTRSQGIGNGSVLIPLDLLNHNECRSLFKLWRQNISDAHITLLSELLQRLPLAISHCLAFMDQEGIKEDQYIKEFQMFKEIQVIGDDSFENPYERLIGKTITMAIGKMKNKQDIESRATTLLHFMAFLNPDQIHSKVLEIILKGKDDRINPVVNILKKFSLISIDGEVSVDHNYIISIHRVVQRSILVLLKQSSTNGNNLVYNNLSQINNQISNYFYSTNSGNRNSLVDCNNLSNINVHLTNIQTIIQKINYLPHQQTLELTSKLLHSQITMQCDHLRYLLLNSSISQSVIENLFQESNIDKNNISELVECTFQLINQNQLLTQGIDIKVALNKFLKVISAEKSIDKDRCNTILMFIILSLGKIGPFLDRDLELLNQISTIRLSIINQLLFCLPKLVLKFSHLECMLTSLNMTNNHFKIVIEHLVQLNSKVKGIGPLSINLIFKSFRSLDVSIFNFAFYLLNENTKDEDLHEILSILFDMKFKHCDNQIQNITNQAKHLFDQIQSIINTKQFTNENMSGYDTPEILSNLSTSVKTYQFNDDQIQYIIIFTGQLINENFNGQDISKIISTISKLITKYKFNNDQIQNIINYTILLINEKMNGYDISRIISTLSEQITKNQLNNDQIHNIINYTKQLINEKMNCDEISFILSNFIMKFKNTNESQPHDMIANQLHENLNDLNLPSIKLINSFIVNENQWNHDQINFSKELLDKDDKILSSLSKLKIDFQVNNDELQNIINLSKQLINENMDINDRVSIISTLIELITKNQLNNDQIQNIINQTKQLIHENMSSRCVLSILLTLYQKKNKNQFDNEQIQRIINHTKQLINGQMDSSDITKIISAISDQITKYQFNNYKIQIVINHTKQLINLNANDYHNIESIISNLTEQISQDEFKFEECLKNDMILNICFYLNFKESLKKLSFVYCNNPLAFEQSYICFLSLHPILEPNQFLKFLEIMIACASEDRNYIFAKFITEHWEWNENINAQTINIAKDKLLSLQEENCCLKNYVHKFKENDEDEDKDLTRVLLAKLNDFKDQDYDFKILSRQFSLHSKLFNGSIIASFKKIKNYLNEQQNFQYLIFQSLFTFYDDQLELICKIIGILKNFKQEYFCCNLHIANNIQRLYYFNFKFTNFGTNENNFLQVLYSQLTDIDNNSKPEWMKTVLFNTFNPKIKFNANI